MRFLSANRISAVCECKNTNIFQTGEIYFFGMESNTEEAGSEEERYLNEIS